MVVNWWKFNFNLKLESNVICEVGFGLYFDDLLIDSDLMKLKVSYFYIDVKDCIISEVKMLFILIYINILCSKSWGWDVFLDY